MLWVGQFGIADGIAREETPWVGVFPDRGREEDASDLYVVVEPALPGSEEFCSELKTAIGGVFHKSKVSLTGGVLRALKAAHENLREWNRRSLRDHRVAAGVSCLAVHGQEAYLAQVAPASAAVYHDAFLTVLEPAMQDAVEPLGLFEEFWPEFTRFEIQEGDRLLLLSPALAHLLAEDGIASALDLPAEEVLSALYLKARSLPNCGALLVAAVPDETL